MTTISTTLPRSPTPAGSPSAVTIALSGSRWRRSWNVFESWLDEQMQASRQRRLQRAVSQLDARTQADLGLSGTVADPEPVWRAYERIRW